MMEDAHGPPANEGRVGVLPFVCEAAQQLKRSWLVCSTMPCLPCSRDPVRRYVWSWQILDPPRFGSMRP